ncbi:uncharacterized mitochondrial protein-like protein [Tanacetum coccineum]
MVLDYSKGTQHTWEKILMNVMDMSSLKVVNGFLAKLHLGATLKEIPSSGNRFVDSITECGALPGIKVDRGRKKLGGITNEFITVGLDSLEARCEEYYTAELIALEAVKAAMVRAGTAREANFGEEVPAFDVDATAVEPEFQKLYSYLFDFENMGYNAKEADRPMPTAIFIVNFDEFWSTIKFKTINGEAQLHALVDGKKIIITESTVRRDLQLEDAEGVDCLPNSTIFEQLTLMGKPKRKDTQVPQPSDPSENVADEAVHKELGDSLVRAVTTASSLEAEQDNGNTTKTRSKAKPNESSSLGTTSGGGPRCQETMGDTIAQTRFENVSKHSNDSLLARGNTLQSDEDILKLNELMELYTNFQNRVLDLKKTKTTQANEIAFSLIARLESSRDEESLGEDASKQGRINAIDADEEITLVSVQDDADKEMFDVDALDGEEVFVAGQNENVVEEVVDVAQVSTVATTVTITTEEITLAQALEALKTSKPKVKGIVFQEPGKSTTTTPISSQQSQDKGKGIMIEEPVKPMKKKDLIKLDEEVDLKLQAEFDKEERLAREKAEKEKEANIALIETCDDIQAKIDADHQLAKKMQAQEQEELSVEEKATLFQQLLEKRRKHLQLKEQKRKETNH